VPSKLPDFAVAADHIAADASIKRDRRPRHPVARQPAMN
jgi:hypothetical protein